MLMNLPAENLTGLSHLSLRMKTSSPSGATGVSFGKANLHQMHSLIKWMVLFSKNWS